MNSVRDAPHVRMCDMTYDFESVSNDAHSHELLSVVAAVHHERVGETLNDGALCLAEALHSVSASRVGDVDWLSDLNVIAVMSLSASLLPLPIAPSHHPFRMACACAEVFVRRT